MEIFILTDETKEIIKQAALKRYIDCFNTGYYPHRSESTYNKLLSTPYEELNSIEECLVPCCDECNVQMVNKQGFKIEVGDEWEQIFYYCRECIKKLLIELDKVNKED